MKKLIFKPRLLLQKVVKHLDNPEITVITGARQVGKTVLLRLLKDWLVKNKNVLAEDIFYFNLDIVKDWEFFQNQAELIEFLKSRSQKRKIYVFVDEAQRVSDCARFFKGIYDSSLNVKLVLTGSASLELKTKLKETLSGRKKIFALSTFSFFEFVSTKDKYLGQILQDFSKISVLDRKKLIALFIEYSLWGGYPKVVLSENKEDKLAVLSEIYSSYIEKDIVNFLEIKNKMGFSRLVRLLSGQSGQLVNVAELAVGLGLDRGTIERYLNALEETFIIKTLLPYYSNPRQEIIKQNKIYFSDMGLRNYCLENFHYLDIRQDGGLLLENAVFKEILISLEGFQKVRFWRTKQGSEVDFLMLKENNFLPVEIKLHLKNPKVSQGQRSFITKYKPKKAVIVNLDIFNKEIQIGETKVFFIYPYEIKKFL